MTAHDMRSSQIEQRSHYVTTSDGATIGGTVHGQGPPLVFVHGVMGDGDVDWQAVATQMASRFTCHLPSYRGRGLSDDHPDLSLGRMVDDILTYVDSIGSPAGVVGWSSGAFLSLAVAAADSRTVAAVAPLEPVVLRLMDADEQAVQGHAGARTAELAAEGQLPGAARAFAAWPFTDEEIAVIDGAGYFESAGRYVPNLLSTLQQWAQHDGPAPDDPAALSAISVSVLVLHGTKTKRFLRASAQYVADHIPGAQVQAITGAGHAALLTHPEALADALTEFFTRVNGPA